MRARFTAVALFACLYVMSAAQAAEYNRVNTTASQISFTYNQMGSLMYGTFGKFDATLQFDSDNLAGAHTTLHIDLNSIDAGSEDANTELVKPAWFDTRRFPVAVFESSRFTRVADNHYLIAGQLTVKGITRAVQVPVELKPESAIGIFDGELVLKRSEFGLGAGEWADTVVSNDIAIKFKVVAPQQ
ncbi:MULTISPECIES: YceI family protein [unclassified Pseudomonas]|jgi:polyisoprenoid-binding protein YceI|uniref:YceI family protein n=1 Tax=unclassified Pseudomonas TaxID=196821 RepID=UPI000C852C35|nr:MULTISPECIES: YceI family protein [unclassified Pseudomonas]MDX9674105.1 YceI family protein [Pseudomonas sp. P8_250]PMQ08419.1 Protein YceI [Pseudomonas sp. AD21]WPN37374.1 YceI family protein [Pseudomonas sp. P8_139]WPN40824.1 YceI family protein [Pseudomonas sp. P8_229]